jgi:hypothetical protein
MATVLAAAFMSAPLMASAQTRSEESQSVAEAARRAREHQKSISKTTKVVTDEDLDKSSMKPGAQGLAVDAPPKVEAEPPSPADVATAVVADNATAPNEADESANKVEDQKIAALKEELATAEKDLDLSKRELALDQDNFYLNPDYVHDTAGKAKLAEVQRQLTEKQDLVDHIKLRLNAVLAEQGRKKHSSPQIQPQAQPQVQPQM